MMDIKRIRPDPCDFQIIAFSNFLQLVNCIVQIVAIFVEQAREAAMIIDIIADLVTYSVAGCMGAQIYHEVKLGKDHQPPVVVVGIQPGGDIPVAQAVPVQGGAPMAEEMER